MTALKLIVTAAGRAALSNAAHDGTAPTIIVSVGITATPFTPLPTTKVIPGESKRISTISGGAVAADTLHVTIRDDSTDTYSVRGVGLYLADGTLFAVYSQATDLLQKSSQATMLLAGDVQFADIDANSLTFGDTNFQMSLATTDVTGVVRFATDAETLTGTDPQLAITPKSLLAALNDRLGTGAPSAFVKTLLNKVSALAFVTALGIRGAASYDTGSNNGLDADLLDGQHGAYYRNYGNLTNVPDAFTPSAHQHSAADITSGTLLVARGGTGAGSFTAGNYLVGNGTGALAEKTPAQVLANIGAAALAHSHPIADINGLQTALDARPLQTAVTTQITAAVNALINGSPGALDTLKELADAMGDDPNFAATMTKALAGKQNSLGFTPVQQGTGTGQLSNAVKIGWSGSKVKVTIDATDMGNVALESWVNQTAILRGNSNSTAGTIFSSGAPPNISSISSSGNDRNTSLQIGNAANNSASATMSFIREGQCGVHFGLDTDNVMKIGGWSYGAVAYRIIHEGVANPALQGTCYATGGFQVGSSKALKTKFKRVRSGLAEVCAIETASYVYKKTYNPDGRRRLGVIAEQLEPLIPEAVSKDGAGRKTVDYAQITPVLIQAIKELSARVDALHA